MLCCTRCVALNPLRSAAPEQKGCHADGSGAAPLKTRVIEAVCRQTTNDEGRTSLDARRLPSGGCGVLLRLVEESVTCVGGMRHAGSWCGSPVQARISRKVRPCQVPVFAWGCLGRLLSYSCVAVFSLLGCDCAQREVWAACAVPVDAGRRARIAFGVGSRRLGRASYRGGCGVVFPLVE